MTDSFNYNANPQLISHILYIVEDPWTIIDAGLKMIEYCLESHCVL